MLTLEMKRKRYIPGSGTRKVTAKNTNAVAYVYELCGAPYAAVFFGNQSKPVGHYKFKSPEKREDYIKRAFEAQANSITSKTKRKAERVKIGNKLQVGHILKSSWGYDQTNVDFYQVLEVKSASVIICKISSTEIEATGWAQGKVVPVIDTFLGEPFLKRVLDGDTIKIESYAYARLWDGRPVQYTAYA